MKIWKIKARGKSPYFSTNIKHVIDKIRKIKLGESCLITKKQMTKKKYYDMPVHN